MILMLFHDKLSHSEREVSQLKIQCKRFHLLLIGPSAGFIEEEKIELIHGRLAGVMVM